ncbi:hypothetical protein HDK64DRAFT_258902 [Phyllosticta capitalensis]
MTQRSSHDDSTLSNAHKPVCRNCGEEGHMSKERKKEKVPYPWNREDCGAAGDFPNGHQDSAYELGQHVEQVVSLAADADILHLEDFVEAKPCASTSLFKPDPQHNKSPV